MDDNANSKKPKDNWANGELYERYVGRWSRLVAREFLQWLAVPAGSHWLDVGCGTGALSQSILQLAEPDQIKGVDRSEGFVSFAKKQVQDRRIQFEVGDVEALTDDNGSFDAAVPGLVLNFVPHPERAFAEMTRVTRSGGAVAVYVWDYAEGMQFIRHFFDAAIALDPDAVEHDEGPRFPICRPDALHRLFELTGLHNLEVRAIEIPTVFRDFDDYWFPFLGGVGAAPIYAMSLDEDARSTLREKIRASLPVQPDGSIHLRARAWGIKGIR
jgi:SAM-dependent methyltransferase